MRHYKRFMTEDRDFLVSLFGEANVQTGDMIPEEYDHDEMITIRHKPDAVVKASAIEQVSGLLEYANKHLIPVTVRGSGTGLVGGAVPVFGGIVLDMRQLNHIGELDRTNMTLTVEAGTLLMDINDFLEKEGFRYPPDPGEKSATVGGNIATNAGGMRAVKYGVTRDWILAIEAVLPDGTRSWFGRNVSKDASGYPLKHLLIGSEGTLAIITRAILKLIPLPKVSSSLLVPFNSIDEALAAVPALLSSQGELEAVELFDREVIGFAEQFLGRPFPDRNNEIYLLLRFNATSEEIVKACMDDVASECIDQLGAIDCYLVDTKERSDSVWQARGAFLEAIKASTSEMDECDVVVPRSNVGQFWKQARSLAKTIGIRMSSFGHAGDGNLHIYLCRDGLDAKSFQERKKLLFDKLYRIADEMGGLVSGEHGIGEAKQDYLKRQLGSEMISLMKGIKNTFDPHHILNPGKIID